MVCKCKLFALDLGQCDVFIFYQNHICRKQTSFVKNYKVDHHRSYASFCFIHHTTLPGNVKTIHILFDPFDGTSSKHFNI